MAMSSSVFYGPLGVSRAGRFIVPGRLLAFIAGSADSKWPVFFLQGLHFVILYYLSSVWPQGTKTLTWFGEKKKEEKGNF